MTRYALDFEKPLIELQNQLESLKNTSAQSNVNVQEEILAIEEKIKITKSDIYSNLTSWQRIQLSRHPQRPYSLDYVKQIFKNFQELHGDRCFKDDRAIVCGTAVFDDQPVVLILQQKGRSTKENLLRNFGSPHPEGYRKALRVMRLAEQFNMPIITFVDTPGAYPGVASEERHVAEAIAVNIREMSQLKVPIVTVIIGEGGSGGALGIAVADAVLILENAYYSVISPEGCAAILWKNRSYAPQAAEALKLSASKLKELNIVDDIIKESNGGAHNDWVESAKYVHESVAKYLKKLKKFSIDELLEKRYKKYRNIGMFEENQ